MASKHNKQLNCSIISRNILKSPQKLASNQKLSNFLLIKKSHQNSPQQSGAEMNRVSLMNVNTQKKRASVEWLKSSKLDHKTALVGSFDQDKRGQINEKNIRSCYF